MTRTPHPDQPAAPRCRLAPLFLLLASNALAAQVPREAALLDGPNGSGTWGAVASSGEFSAAAFVEDGTNNVVFRRGDGRGLGWEAGIRVDSDGTGSEKEKVVVVIVAKRAIVFWIDSRDDDPGTFPEENALYSCYVDLKTGEASTEQVVDLGLEQGDLTLSSFATSVCPIEQKVFAVGSSFNFFTGSRVILTSSADLGETFEPPTYVAAQGTSSSEYGFACDAGRAYLLWSDEDAPDGPALRLQWAATSSPSAVFPESEMIVDEPVGEVLGGVAVDASRNVLALAWSTFDPTSADGSVNLRTYEPESGRFGTKHVLRKPPSSPKNLGVVLHASRGTLTAAWRDAGLGDLVGAWAVSTEDLGATLGPVHNLASYSNSSSVELVLGRGRVGGRDVAVARWVQVDEGVVRYVVRMSVDGGLHWEPPFTVDEGAQFYGAAPIVYNARYRNFLVPFWRPGFADPEPGFYVGGFRPQTATLEHRSGTPGVGFEFEYFDPATEQVVWALAALAPSDLVDLGGKVLGLGSDSLLVSSALLSASGQLAAEVDASGAGATSSISVGLPAGITFYYVGLGLNLRDATVGNITDVVRVDT